jgi:nucleotide-binding universal stress UspA family protein
MTGDRPSDLFERVLVPVASEEDARRATDVILPYLPGAGSVVVVHVIKQSEGGIDPSPVDAQEEEAEQLFDIVTEDDEAGDVETRTAYGSDVVDSILETARETGATVIAVSPREKSLLMRLLTGDHARSLMMNRDVPVLAVPAGEE